MTDAERARLLAITAKWRETAEIWKGHRLSKWTGPTPRTEPMPPEKGRGTIHNWENWLNNCAQQIEDAIGAPPEETP